LVDFGQFRAIWDNLNVHSGANVSASEGGRQSLHPVWSILDNVGQIRTISTSILGKCQCFSGRATIDSESIDFQILSESISIKSRNNLTLSTSIDGSKLRFKINQYPKFFLIHTLGPGHAMYTAPLAWKKSMPTGSSNTTSRQGLPDTAQNDLASSTRLPTLLS
jgi:hypothetical protein